MKVLRGLFFSSEPRHVRELARDYELSPGGVADILRRLRELGLVKDHRVKNRKGYTLHTSDAETHLLEKLFTLYEQELIARRVPDLEKGAHEKLRWMDEAYRFYKSVKQSHAHSS